MARKNAAMLLPVLRPDFPDILDVDAAALVIVEVEGHMPELADVRRPAADLAFFVDDGP